LLKQFVPDLQVESVHQIDLRKLWDQGFRGIITDLDNTLVGAGDSSATPELIDWLEKVDHMGFKVVIVSNNQRSRVAAFSDPLNIPYIFRARKPTGGAFRRALSILQLTPRQTVVIGDQLMTDILGGNRMGFYTILVQPISMKDEGFLTRQINRRLERVARYLTRNHRR